MGRGHVGGVVIVEQASNRTMEQEVSKNMQGGAQTV